MRIGWVTPFNEGSAIGRVSAAVAQGLVARGHEVLVVRSEQDPCDAAPAIATALPVEWWHDVPAAELQHRCDVVALAIGDNFPLHAGIFRYLADFACVGIFHDFYLHNLFNGWVAAQGGGDEIHDREIRLACGDDALELARRARRGGIALAEMAEQLPMTGWVSARCGAALAHAHFYRDRLEADCPGPVAVAYLSQEPRPVPPLPEQRDSKDVVIATIGVVNPNKCAEAVIEAIGSSQNLRSKCRYRLVGPISTEQRDWLGGLAQRLRVRLDILGEVAASELEAELERADIICALRRPVLEGASASAIEGMMSGRPIVVADAGFYGELPDQYVCKVPSDVNTDALTAVLEALVLDEALRCRIGTAARAWARETFTTERYVEGLQELLSAFVATKPHLALARRIGDDLAALGLAGEDPAVQRIATSMQNLFAAKAASEP